MGDPRRFDVLADHITTLWPDRDTRIADVAGGKGHLNAALHLRGYRNVVTFDQRPDRWTTRPHYRYGLFQLDDADGFDALVALHPDEATDVTLAAAQAHGLPFTVVPCCARPTVWDYDRSMGEWFAHLHARVPYAEVTDLPMRGANRALTCPTAPPAAA